MSLDREGLLALHRRLVEIPSPSHEETDIADFVEGFLREFGAPLERVENNVIAFAGRGPRLLLNSHLDTVPPTSAWTRDPFEAAVEDGRVHGLGSNDALASVVGMIATYLEVLERGGPCEVALVLVPEEETGGRGTEIAWPWLQERGWEPDGVVVGEPTALEVATSQKGLLSLELVAKGDAVHSANAAATGARNPIRALARDLVVLESADLGPAHPDLGPCTLEPTVLRAGTRRNMVPAEAACDLDVRSVPGLSHDELVAQLRHGLEGELKVRSKRLVPYGCPEGAQIIHAAQRARPESSCYGSRTMSDLVWFAGHPGIKVGPGRTERSHTPDEYVEIQEIVDGAAFYGRLVEEFAATATGDAG